MTTNDLTIIVASGLLVFRITAIVVEYWRFCRDNPLPKRKRKG